MTKFIQKLAIAVVPLTLLMAGCGGSGNHVNGANSYKKTVLVANKASYNPQIVEPSLSNAWGLSLRPAGAGGHWWITANSTGKSIEYVGDVNGVPLHQDALKEVAVYNTGKSQGTPTGVVFNTTGPGFVITQTFPDTTTVTAPAKFLFATDTGVLDAWTERVNGDGTKSFPPDCNIVWDKSAAGAAYFGLALSPTNDRVYLADFGTSPKVTVLNDQFQDITADKFVNPFPGYAPWNCQTIGNSIFVAYAKQEEAAEELHGAGIGRLAEFDVNGSLIATWNDKGLLNAPWGIVMAPATFGLYAGKLLVGNFGNGLITVFDPATRTAIDYLRGSDGKPLVIDGLWDMKFGNGVSLGQSNALYYAAGPNGETDGVFGRITAQ